MKARHLRVIREIHEKIPAELIGSLMKKEIQAPTIKKVVEIALTKPDEEVSRSMKRRLRALLDSGMLDREVEVVDESVEKQIDALIGAEIDKAVRLGRLPKKAPTLELLNNKGKQYVRRQQKRLHDLTVGTHDDVVLQAEDNSQNQAQHSPREADGGVLLTPRG